MNSRLVAIISISTLVVVVLLNWHARQNDTTVGPLELRVFSTGNFLTPQRYGSIQTVGGVFVNNRRISGASTDTNQSIVAVGADGQGKAVTINPGLRLSAFTADGQVVSQRSYDLAMRREDTEALIRDVTRIQTNLAITMAVVGEFGRRETQIEVYPEPVLALFKQMGSQAPLREMTAASWAFIVLRRPHGWVPLAEAYSRHRGVRLGLTLEQNWSSYDWQPIPHLIQDHAISLIPMVFQAKATTTRGYTQLNTNTVLAEHGLPAVLACPPYGSGLKRYPHGQNRLTFARVKLGPRPVFRCQIGSRAAPARRGGVIYEVRVDGEVVATRPFAATEQEIDRWYPWMVGLERFSNRTVELELRMLPGGPLTGEWAAWGDPVIADDGSVSSRSDDRTS